MIGIVGIVLIIFFCWLFSKYRKAIVWQTVIVGLLLQVAIGWLILKTENGASLFNTLGHGITHLLGFAMDGARFVFGPLADGAILSKSFGAEHGFIFAFTIIPAIIFVCVLVNIFYYWGVIPRLVSVLASGMKRLMRISGSESLSNIASIFVGQVEAQVLIRPYLQTMTRSELLSSMAGGMACIAGGMMAIYIGMGIEARYILGASLMAAPGALVVSKLLLPETEKSDTWGKTKIKAEHHFVNHLDAIAQGAQIGLKVGLSVVGMLIGMLALVALIDYILVWWAHGIELGSLQPNAWYHWPSHMIAMGWKQLFGWFDIDSSLLSLRYLAGKLFYWPAVLIGVPYAEAAQVGSLMGSKLVINEFVAYVDLTHQHLSQQAYCIASFALCGFANLGSVAIQLGGIGQLMPTRKAELAKLGMKALLCGTLANYLSAAIAGLINLF